MRREIAFTCETPERIGGLLMWVEQMATKGLAAGAVVCRLGRPNRTKDQNALIHPVVRQIIKHMHANGSPKRSEEWWRHYLVAKHAGQEIVPDPCGDGSFVVMNKVSGTSDMKVPEASEFIEWMYAWGAEIGVEWEEREAA